MTKKAYFLRNQTRINVQTCSSCTVHSSSIPKQSVFDLMVAIAINMMGMHLVNASQCSRSSYILSQCTEYGKWLGAFRLQHSSVWRHQERYIKWQIFRESLPKHSSCRLDGCWKATLADIIENNTAYKLTMKRTIDRVRAVICEGYIGFHLIR